MLKVCFWNKNRLYLLVRDVIGMNGYLLRERVIRMSEYSDICWNLYLRAIHLLR